MSDFKQVKVTTKADKHCVVCLNRLATGTDALAKFTKTRFGIASVFVCDADCLVSFREKEPDESIDGFLNKLSIQFN